MAYAISPTPAGASSLDAGLGSRPVSRNTFTRNASLRPAPTGTMTRAAAARQQQQQQQQQQKERAQRSKDAGSADSSDDDDDGPAPALSAAAEMLLRTQDRAEHQNGGRSAPASKAWEFHSGSPKSRAARSPPRRDGSPSPRVVRLNRNSPVVSGLRRSVSSSEIVDGSPQVRRRAADLKTPATTRPRSALASSASVNYSSAAKAGSGALASTSKPSSADSRPATGQDGAPPGKQSVRQQPEDRGLHNSIRIKRTERVAGFTGSFLRGPARRGIIRRQSEDQSPTRDQNEGPQEEQERLNGNEEEHQHDDASPVHRAASKSAPSHVRFAAPIDTPKDSGQSEAGQRSPLQPVIPLALTGATDSKPGSAISLKKDLSAAQPIVYKLPPPLPSQLDQENEPPPTFKRTKPDSAVLAVHKLPMQSVEKVRGQGSPERKPLAPRSQNTPLRPAPPPPKMTVLETATATAGAASVAQTKKKRNYISVNNKLFTRMECVGRGGSGRVYRVMAENFKIFALKRVSLEDVDEVAIRGFKGEIDLLRRLQNVERVVRLYDFEVNDEKKTLSVLMEFGELDLKKILDPHVDEETGKLDLTFTRRMWKEMLECVKAIHEHDVVHSDLKPANFVMMQGRLKLIDFGIANAIQDDTVNVHREHQVGTPNYMAPEAILDTNALSRGAAGRVPGAAKLMKLGKPSDVWSLGCILYQMVYGKTPFSHIPNSMSKALAITDRTHAIVFPELGVGNVPVPSGLLRTLRGCLSRDPTRRPSIDQLLDARDPFLYPDAAGAIPVTQEIVRRLQENVLKIIDAKGMPTATDKPREVVVKEWLDEWSPQLFASIKASMEKGMA